MRLKPAELAEFKPRSMKKDYEHLEEQEEKPESAAVIDEFQVVDKPKRGPAAQPQLTAKQRKAIEKQKHLMAEESDEPIKEEPVQVEEAKPQLQPFEDDEEMDDEEQGGQWITSDNIEKHLHGDAKKATNLMLLSDARLFDDQTKKAVEEEKVDNTKVQYVKMVTSDFAM